MTKLLAADSCRDCGKGQGFAEENDRRCHPGIPCQRDWLHRPNFTQTFFRVVADCYSAPPRHPGQVQSFHHNDYVPGSEEEGADGFETMRQPSSDYLLSVH